MPDTTIPLTDKARERDVDGISPIAILFRLASHKFGVHGSMPNSNAQRRRLTVALMVRDDLELVRVTLASVAEIADEILIVDTAAVPQSAAHFGVNCPPLRVLHHPWQEDFSQARNRALDEVSGDWILWLDTGETLDSSDAASTGPLRRFVDQQATTDCAYMMLVQTPPAPGALGGEQIARLRLIPALPHLRFEGAVRETLWPAVRQLGLRVEGIPWRIARGAHEHDGPRKVARARRDLQLAQRVIDTCGSSADQLNCLGNALSILQDPRRAANCYSAAVAASESASTEKLEAYYGLLTALDSLPELRDRQLTVAAEALQCFPTDIQLLCAMGGYLQRRGRLDLALRSYQTAFEYGCVNPCVWHLQEVHEVAAVCCSLSLQMQNQEGQAHDVLQRALKQSPASARVRRHLLDLAIKQADEKGAIEQGLLLSAEPTQRMGMIQAIRGACLAAQQQWTAAKALLQDAYREGCRDAICMKWLAATWVALGDRSQARRILSEWGEQVTYRGEVSAYLRLLLDGNASSSQLPASSSVTHPRQATRHSRAGSQAAPGLPHVLSHAQGVASLATSSVTVQD